MNVNYVDNFDLTKLCKIDDNRDKKYYPFLLESVINNDNNRYSILFAHPQESIISYDHSNNFLQQLQSKLIVKNNVNNIPFSGGYFVYLSYELTGQIEPSLTNYMYTASTPIAYAVFIPSAIIKDHKKQITYIIDIDDNQHRINKILLDINKISIDEDDLDLSGKLDFDDENIFLNNVEIIKKYIKAGDIFQANLSREWRYKLNNKVADIDIYKLLKKSNPSPFAVFAKYADFSIISSSPERLFSVNNNIIQTRPIAGTCSRGNDKKLITSLKEQAEHLMLLDLERNDLGRICQYGSVIVNEMMLVESYKFVHHIVSNIKGKLKKNITFANIIKAIFPGGTITGCPKIRSIQIISELEKTVRSAYTGSVGYISNNGKIDFNILIRTIIKQNNNLSFRAGAGIVADSIAKKELLETKYKAQGIINLFE